MRDLRKIKAIALLMSVMTCLLMFSVGFSAWFKISAPAPIVLDGNKGGRLEAYDVLTIHMKENDGMEMFKSSLLSFKTSETLADTDTGSIKVTYVVPQSTVAATDGSFQVDFSLGYSSLTSEGHKLFGHAFSATYSDNSFSASVAEAKSTAVSLNTDSDTIDCVCTFEGIDTTKDFEFTLIYTFKIPSGLNFKNSFGQYLNGTESTAENSNADTTKFSASALVTDK